MRFYEALCSEDGYKKKGKIVPHKFGRGLVPRTKRFKHVDGHIVFIREKGRLEKKEEKKEENEVKIRKMIREARSCEFQPA
ncbi:MAG: hypothetical protein N3G22_02200 [Candidatus Micrarchaeota archaeon]|nr:hypothetical protein [Candidatus Micrarchaeota archaeon]